LPPRNFKSVQGHRRKRKKEVGKPNRLGREDLHQRESKGNLRTHKDSRAKRCRALEKKKEMGTKDPSEQRKKRGCQASRTQGGKCAKLKKGGGKGTAISDEGGKNQAGFFLARAKTDMSPRGKKKKKTRFQKGGEKPSILFFAKKRRGQGRKKRTMGRKAGGKKKVHGEKPYQEKKMLEKKKAAAVVKFGGERSVPRGVKRAPVGKPRVDCTKKGRPTRGKNFPSIWEGGRSRRREKPARQKGRVRGNKGEVATLNKRLLGQKGRGLR